MYGPGSQVSRQSEWLIGVSRGGAEAERAVGRGGAQAEPRPSGCQAERRPTGRAGRLVRQAGCPGSPGRPASPLAGWPGCPGWPDSLYVRKIIISSKNDNCERRNGNCVQGTFKFVRQAVERIEQGQWSFQILMDFMNFHEFYTGRTSKLETFIFLMLFNGFRMVHLQKK